MPPLEETNVLFTLEIIDNILHFYVTNPVDHISGFEFYLTGLRENGYVIGKEGWLTDEGYQSDEVKVKERRRRIDSVPYSVPSGLGIIYDNKFNLLVNDKLNKILSFGSMSSNTKHSSLLRKSTRKKLLFTLPLIKTQDNIIGAPDQSMLDVPSNYTCHTNQECDDGMVCIGGICRSISGTYDSSYSTHLLTVDNEKSLNKSDLICIDSVMVSDRFGKPINASGGCYEPGITIQQRPCRKGYIWDGTDCVFALQPASDDYDVLQDIIDINNLPQTLEEFLAYNQSYLSWNGDRLTSLDLSCQLNRCYLTDLGVEITQLPESLGNLSELTFLGMQGVGLTTLPQSTGNLTNLEELVCYGMDTFTSLPSTIGGCVSLRLLYLQGNKITDLPQSFGNLVSLERLDIYGNELGAMDSMMNDDVFQNLTNLRILKMHANPSLMELPESICNCSSLEELYAYPNDPDCGYGCTGLWFLPECLHELTNLWYLHLNGNQFETIDFDICSMTNLEEVYMNDNNLTGDLPECIAGMGFEYGNFQIARNKLWCDYSNPETGCEQGCAPSWFCDDDAFLNSSGGCSSSGYTNQRCD